MLEVCNDVSILLDVFFTKDLPETPNSGFGEKYARVQVYAREGYAK